MLWERGLLLRMRKDFKGKSSIALPLRRGDMLSRAGVLGGICAERRVPMSWDGGY